MDSRAPPAAPDHTPNAPAQARPLPTPPGPNRHVSNRRHVSNFHVTPGRHFSAP
jgi:hypothetical protein